jgi:DNA repair exonuclease SbcCD ATPase subunit
MYHVTTTITSNLTRSSPIPGAQEKIATMRQRHAQVTASIDYYEERLAQQTSEFHRLNRNRDFLDEMDHVEEEPQEAPALSEEDLKREEEEMKQLERKKRELEDRVHSMSRDISGLR